uniref:Serine/threonine-protein phosphatase 6 regulatory ankyrin repeat subunit C-like n=1 Tax=Sinocyclocheilus rhinocerous TaxID=307959 RepID=A0A673H6X5_9TELE
AKDQEWLTPLHRAAASQNEGSVVLLLRKGAEVNAQDRFCQTALHVAAANRAMKCVDTLIPYVSSLNAAYRFGRTALHHAVHSGHTVTLLLNKGANVSARDIKDRQPIHLAAHLGHLEVVRLLVACSADVSCRDKQGFTPLHAAALGGHTEVVQYLLKHGAEIDEADGSGNSALHMVCYAGQRAVASELVNCGASVNRSNVRGCTPLHLSAASADGVLCLELLVNNGANNKAGKSPLHVAAIHGHFTRSQILLQNGAEVECVDIYGNTPLHSAAKHGHELLITTLLNNGADVARRGINGMTPLHLAVFYGFSDCCQKLLSSGFDINTVDSLGRTCLHVAASGGNVECLKLLLNSGAALNKKDNFGRSPLHYTSVNGSYLCTVALVKAGADVNELDVNGCSPLHYAAAAQTSHRYNTYNTALRTADSESIQTPAFFHILCLEFLLHSGADPTLRDSKGFSPVHYAAACGDRHNLKLVRKLFSWYTIPFHLAAYNGHSEALQVLSETLVNVDIQDPRGHTALYMAALRGHGPCVELLLLQGASYAIREHIHRWTPLHASGSGQTDCLLMMLQRDEKNDIFDLMDIHGQTPLMLATLGSHIDCVHMLLERGSNPDTGDRRSRTALHRAVSLLVGSEECVSALLVHGASSLCRDIYGRSPLHLAASCGHAWLLRPLLDAASLSDPLDSLLDYSAYTPTHWAAYHGHNDCLEALLEYRPSMILTSSSKCFCTLSTIRSISSSFYGKGRTPLHASAYAGNVAALKLALTCGSHVNSVDYTGRSALMVAAENGHTSAVDILLHQAGADLSLLDIDRNSALHIACRRSHEMCALLILAETDDPTLINTTNTALQTPLHIAARNGLATVVEVLLTRGATVLAIDQDGDPCPKPCLYN